MNSFRLFSSDTEILMGTSDTSFNNEITLQLENIKSMLL